jgi:hypothetical protein
LTSDFSPKGYGRDSSGGNAHVFSPNGPWATVRGYCDINIGESTTFDGTEVKVGTLSNSKEIPAIVREVIGEYETQGLKWNTTFNIDLDVYEVIQLYEPRRARDPLDWAGTAVPYFAQIRGPVAVMPPCSVLNMFFTPLIRMVPVWPLFQVLEYSMDSSGHTNEWIFETTVRQYDNWRNWGENWESIFSSGYYLHGTAEAQTGMRPPEGIVVYYYERQSCT